MSHQELRRTARAMVAEGKGILAADESTGTVTKRFETHGIESNPENRRRYREMLLLAPGGERCVSGAILYDETIRQSDSEGSPFAQVLAAHGILPGIKVDTGAKPLAGAPGETVTEGLDGLRERLAEYHGLGARFAKWRAVISIGDRRPGNACVAANAHALARYAALCQEAEIVPIVEPEVLMDGDHSLERCAEVTERVLRAVFAALAEQQVLLEGMVLKPNMVLAGAEHPEQASVEQVAAATLRSLGRAVPAAVPGIAFLSGGQGAELATAHLQAMAERGPHPWDLTFSYGRALQEDALAAWGGDEAHFVDGREAFLRRARANGAARDGRWAADPEPVA